MRGPFSFALHVVSAAARPLARADSGTVEQIPQFFN